MENAERRQLQKAGRTRPCGATRAEGEEKKELTGGWWEAGKGEGYPPGLGGVCQKEARVGACVRVDNGVHWWSDLEIGSLDEYKIWAAALEKKYPKYQSLDKHWCETAQYRTAQCMQARDYCWNKLDRDTLGKVWQDRTNEKMPSRLDLFRVDMFNNVVMNGCSPKAVCAWEVDHIFPWARGGCSVQTNFAGVQWGANNKKRDKIIQGMDLGPECASKLQVGLSPGAFVTLFMFCDQLLPHTRSSRQNVRALQDRAVYFLRGSPMVGQAKVNLAETLGHDDEKALASLDPARLWELLDQHMNPLPWLGLHAAALATH